MKFKKAIICLMLLALSACGGGGGEKAPYAGVKIGKPYQIYGRWYEPSYSAHYDEIGMASWYGPGFHGGHTASGERFDQNAMTAAHRTLPLPSIVRVTNLDNGVSALIKVNDRGPFSHDRIIDLSRAAALKLGVYRTGTAKVRVQFLDKETREYVQNSQNGIGYAMGELKTVNPEEASAREEEGMKPQLQIESKMFEGGEQVLAVGNTAAANQSEVPGGGPSEFSVVDNENGIAPPATAPSAFFVQAGTFASQQNADNLSERLSDSGTTQVMEIMLGGKKMYRVMVGPFEARVDAKNMLSKVASAGIPDARIIRN